MGRPPEPVPRNKADAVLEWMKQGKPLLQYCEKEGTPSRSAIYAWVEKDPEFAEQFARAKQMGNEVLEEQQLALADAPPMMTSDGKIDPAYVQWKKLQIETRQKMLANRDPAKYGTKAHLEHSGKLSLEGLIADSMKLDGAPDGDSD